LVCSFPAHHTGSALTRGFLPLALKGALASLLRPKSLPAILSTTQPSLRLVCSFPAHHTGSALTQGFLPLARIVAAMHSSSLSTKDQSAPTATHHLIASGGLGRRLLLRDCGR